MLINTKRVQSALSFASKCHGDVGQMRATDTPYIVHPYAVMGIVQRYSSDYGNDLENALCVAALHDSLEDTKATEATIRELFGNQVLAGVQAMTKNKAIENKLDCLLDSLERALHIGPWVVGIKCCDRIENLSFVTIPDSWSRKKKIEYVHKEAAIILYHGRKAGMHQTSDRLEHAMHVYEQYITDV